MANNNKKSHIWPKTHNIEKVYQVFIEYTKFLKPAASTKNARALKIQK